MTRLNTLRPRDNEDDDNEDDDNEDDHYIYYDEV